MNPNNSHFDAKRVKRLRCAMCLDLTNFAAVINVDRTTVWRWEELGITPNRLACEAMLREEEKLNKQEDTCAAARS